MISLSEYDKAVQAARAEHPEWRNGQTLFNVLYDLEPDLANEVRATELDPFYNDNVKPFVEWLFDRLPSEMPFVLAP